MRQLLIGRDSTTSGLLVFAVASLVMLIVCLAVFTLLRRRATAFDRKT